MNKIITQGLGTNNQLITQGYGQAIEAVVPSYGIGYIGGRIGQRFFRRRLEYQLILPLITKSKIEYVLAANISVVNRFEKSIKLPVIKQLRKQYPVSTKINNKKFLAILKFL